MHKQNILFFFPLPTIFSVRSFLTFLHISVEAAGGKALACVVDIRDEQQISEAVQKAVDKFGGKKKKPISFGLSVRQS